MKDRPTQECRSEEEGLKNDYNDKHFKRMSATTSHSIASAREPRLISIDQRFFNSRSLNAIAPSYHSHCRYLLPVIVITLLLRRLLGLHLRLRTPRRPARRPACRSADDVVAGVAVCYALFVVGAAGLCGLQCVGLYLWLDCCLALGKVGCGGLGDGCSGGFGGGSLVDFGLGAGGPVYFFFVGGRGCCVMLVLCSRRID